jgi:hypothetical protein
VIKPAAGAGMVQVIRLNDDVARQVAGRGDAPRVATPGECFIQGGATSILNKKNLQRRVKFSSCFFIVNNYL